MGIRAVSIILWPVGWNKVLPTCSRQKCGLPTVSRVRPPTADCKSAALSRRRFGYGFFETALARIPKSPHRRSGYAAGGVRPSRAQQRGICQAVEYFPTNACYNIAAPGAGRAPPVLKINFGVRVKDNIAMKAIGRNSGGQCLAIDEVVSGWVRKISDGVNTP